MLFEDDSAVSWSSYGGGVQKTAPEASAYARELQKVCSRPEDESFKRSEFDILVDSGGGMGVARDQASNLDGKLLKGLQGPLNKIKWEQKSRWPGKGFSAALPKCVSDNLDWQPEKHGIPFHYDNQVSAGYCGVATLFHQTSAMLQKELIAMVSEVFGQRALPNARGNMDASFFDVNLHRAKPCWVWQQNKGTQMMLLPVGDARLTPFSPCGFGFEHGTEHAVQMSSIALHQRPSAEKELNFWCQKQKDLSDIQIDVLRDLKSR